MEEQVTSLNNWLPVFALLTTCRLGTSNKCRYATLLKPKSAGLSAGVASRFTVIKPFYKVKNLLPEE